MYNCNSVTFVAGAPAEWARHYMDIPHNESYVSKFEEAGIKELNLNTIWPALEVDPEALGMKGWSGEHIEFLTQQFAEMDKRRARDW